MGFDAQNFGLGLLAGWGSAYVVYRSRGAISRVVQQLRGSAATAQNQATRSADSRYVSDIIRASERSHLLGTNVPLSAVAVEPRFIAAPALPEPASPDQIYDVFRVIPLIHEHPYLYAPYPVETLAIDELALGERHLALLGKPGSGRTTALHIIALHSLGGVKFTPPEDRVQKKLDSDEAALSEKERAVRIKERITIEQRAKERLASEKGLVFNAQADEELKKIVPLFNRLMPVFVHMGDLLAPTNEYGASVDPAEPIVRAVQSQVGRITASTIPRNLYKRLNKGEVLLLLDGFDDIPETEVNRALAWLRAFKAQYGQNFLIVTGPVSGSGRLQSVGLTPVYLRPWNDLDVNAAAERLASAWSAAGGRKKRGGQRPAPEAIARATKGTRGLTTLEVTQKMIANFSESVEQPGFEGWMRTTLARLLPADEPLNTLLPTLSRLAALQLDEGYLTAERLESMAGLAGMTPVEAAPIEAAGEQGEAGEMTPAEGKRKSRRGKANADDADAPKETAQRRLLGMLERSGLLDSHRMGRFRFRHAPIAAYLASLWLKDNAGVEANSRKNRAEWAEAFTYLALHTDVTAQVTERLNGGNDLMYSRLFAAARAVAYAPADALWRGEILRDLGNLMVAPNMYPAIRERAAAALIETRDRSVNLVFRRAVRNINPAVRVLGCLGLGALGETEGIRDLVPLLEDKVSEVQLAAGMGLGAIGTDEALEAMVTSFTQGAEPLRQAIAEALSLLPTEGYPVLFDAVQDQDMMLRRASIFGLRRIRTTWALIAIYRAFLEDDQWYVRSAAQQMFEELQYGRPQPLTYAYPPPETLPWLKEWAAGRGENVPPGDGAQLALLRALQEGEPPVRALAAQTIGQFGYFNALKSLYAALRDRQDEVRAAAHRALGLLGTQIGQPLPAP